jgi:hypothetical protein
MKKIYSSYNPMLVAQLRQVLEANHVDCLVRNDYLQGAAGELPPTECWPEIWVVHDFQHDKARDLVEAFLDAGELPGGPWTCDDCGEALDPVFSQCWRCGYERPAWE